MKTILEVKVKRILDTNPDTSWIGEYSNTPKDGAIDRKERGDMGRNEYQYFNPANPEYSEQEYKRMEDLNNQQFNFIGITAEAKYTIGNIVQTLHSGGLWGIESDSDKSYLEEVEQEQLAELRTELKALGFTKRQIDSAFSKVEESEFCYA